MKPQAKNRNFFYVYIVKCKDSSLYTGYTKDLERRIVEHNTLKVGARYTKQRRPVILKYFERFRTLKKALQREIEIKKLKREEKLELILNSKLRANTKSKR